MTQADYIRQLHAQGLTPPQIVELLGCSRAAVTSALAHTRKPGRPKVARCEHCGQRMPAQPASQR